MQEPQIQSARRPTPPVLLWRKTWSAVRGSVLLRLVLFAVVVWFVGQNGQPWELGWLRIDEAEEIAESFLVQQRAPVGDYILIRAVERNHDGTWYGSENEARFGIDPAVGYVFRFFRAEELDGWTVAVSPTGRIYRVQREQHDDNPDVRLGHNEAMDLVLEKLATDLAIPSGSLDIRSDTLIAQFQRSDWIFHFGWPQALDSTGSFTVTLSGQTLTALSFDPPPPRIPTAPAHRPGERRLLGFLLILSGCFLIMHYHRTPLTLRTAGVWGTIVFFVFLAVRSLTFAQSVLLIPWDIPMRGYLARAALGAIVDSVQAALLIGLVIATGEALARDVFRKTSTLSRPSPGATGWTNDWNRAACWALPVATVFLFVEAAAAYFIGPAGMTSRVPEILANTLSSPVPALTLPLEVGLEVFWEETVFRLWLLTLILFWLRLPALAIPIQAMLAAFFAGYDFSQLVTAGGAFHLAYGLAAGLLMIRAGFLSALLFHGLVLGGYASLAAFWTGLDRWPGMIVMGLLLITLLIAVKARPPWGRRLENLPSEP